MQDLGLLREHPVRTVPVFLLILYIQTASRGTNKDSHTSNLALRQGRLAKLPDGTKWMAPPRLLL